MIEHRCSARPSFFPTFTEDLDLVKRARYYFSSGIVITRPPMTSPILKSFFGL